MAEETPYLKIIDYIFYNESLIRELVEEVKLKSARSEIHNASNLSDPTAAVAIKNLTPVTAIILDKRVLKFPEHWLEVVDLTKKWCRQRGEIFYQILRRRYTDEETEKICADLSISTDFYYRTLGKIRTRAALIASWYHLICVMPNSR